MLLACLIAVLCLTNAAMFVQARRPAAPPALAPDDPRLRWRALPAEERRTLQKLYERIHAREDAAEVLERARRIAALPDDLRQRQRSVRALMSELLRRQTPAQRADLLRSSPETRAVLLYHYLRDRDPARLAAMRAAWAVDP
jgi:hypothetical protein